MGTHDRVSSRPPRLTFAGRYAQSMDAIRRFNRPLLRRPQAIIAFGGWNDACDAATGSAGYVLEQHDEPEPFAAIDPEEFFDFTEQRPIVEIDDGGTRSLSWPVTRFYPIELPDHDRDLIVVIGEEPHLRWRTFSRLLTQVLSDEGVEFVVTLGAFIGQLPHTLPVPVIGVGTDPQLVTELGLATSSYEGPTGIVGVTLEACREAGIPALSLWAPTPPYLTPNPYPKAMLAMLTAAGRALGTAIDVSELQRWTDEFEDKVNQAVQASSDLARLVERLEDAVDEVPDDGLSSAPDAGARLIADVEEFLRGQST